MARPSPVPPYFRVIESVGLLKGLENQGMLLRGDSDSGVGDRKVESDLVFGFGFQGNGQFHPSFFGKFDGISDQIDE